MNIATFYFSMGNGGIEKVVTLLIRKWKALGHNVILFTDQKPEEDDYIDEDEVERIVLSGDYGETSLRRKQWQDCIEKYHIDVMVYHAWGNPKMKWDREVLQENGIPFIVYTHGVFSTIYHDRNNYTSQFLDEIKKCDTVISLTKVSQLFYQILGIRSVFMQNPIEPKLLNAKTSQLNSNQVIWVGRMIPEKKPQDAVEVFAKVKEQIPDAKMIMVGKGPEENAVKELIGKLQLEGSVELAGYTKDVGEYYEKAAVMLYTSMYEGFSMVLLESKAYGIPCVMYELPYLSMTEEPKGLRIVQQDDVKHAAEDIIDLLSDRAKLEELGAQARASLIGMNQEYDDNKWQEIFEESRKRYEGQDTVQKQMLELLLEHEEYGVKMTCDRIHNSMTYRLGDALLRIPKYLVGLCRERKND